MGETTQRSLDAAHNNGNMGVEALEYLTIYRCGVVGAEASLATCGVGVVATQTYVCRVVVHHRVHSACRDSEEQSRRTQLGEVAQVVTPVGLRHDGYTIPLCLQQSSDDGSTKGGVVDIGITREEDYINIIPPQRAHLLYGCW